VNAGVEVGVGPSTAAQIQAAITGTSPGNQTPTMAAIKAAVAYFNTLNDGLPHYILLATDGEPNCDPGTSSNVTDASVMDTAGVIGTANTSSKIKNLRHRHRTIVWQPGRLLPRPAERETISPRNPRTS